MKTIIAFIATLLLAGVASAQDGWVNCTSGQSQGTVASGTPICVDLTDATDPSSELLAVGHCRDNFDLVYESDQGGAGTAISIQIMTCVSPFIDADSCKPWENVTLLGTNTSFTIGGAWGQWVYIDGTGTRGTELPRVLLKCN